MLCDLVLEAWDDCSAEPFHLAVGLEVVAVCPQVLNYQMHDHCCIELGEKLQSIIGQYVPFRYTVWDDQLSTNTVVSLVDATVVTGMTIVSFVHRSVRTITGALPGLVFDKGPKMLIYMNLSGLAAASTRVCF